MNYTIFDGLALSDLHFEPDHPKPFRLFAMGENPLTRNGAPCVLHLTAEDVKAMADYQHSKGKRSPLTAATPSSLLPKRQG